MKNVIFELISVAKIMKKRFYYFLFIIFFTSCNSTKYVAEEEFMLKENIVFIDSVKTNSGNLEKYILQKPNTRLLGLPLGLYFYNLGNPNKPKTVKEWAEKNPKSYQFIKSIFSEKQSIAYANSFINLNNWYLKNDAPEIINKSKIQKTADNLWAYYKTQGFFESKVDTVIQRNDEKKAYVTYHISKGKPTILDTISVKIASRTLDSIYKNSKLQSFLKSGTQYKDQDFRAEASSVVKLFRNSGIFHFSEAALGFYVDSTRTDYKTNVDFLISSNRLSEVDGSYIETPYKIHTIKEVTVHTDYYFTKKNEAIKDSSTYEGINFIANDKIKFNPKYLSQSIFLKPGEVYKDTLRNLTRNHLKSLQNFKSTSLQFTPLSETNGDLRMDIFLTPMEKYNMGLETEITHSNIRNIGTSAKFSITNRNAFRGAELVKISVLGSWFNSNNGPGWELGADVSIEMPRFVAPFGIGKLVPKEMSPRTYFSIGSSFQKNIGLDRQTFSFMTDFKWQFNAKKTIQLEVLNTQYVKNLNVSSFFDIYSSEFRGLNDIAQIYPGIAGDLPTDATKYQATLNFMSTLGGDAAFQASNPKEYNTVLNIQNRFNIVTSDFLIPVIAYSFTFNNQFDFKDKNFSFFKVRISNSGNILGLLSNQKNSNNKRTFFNIPLAQYFKTDIEYKKFWGVGNNSVFAIRGLLGAIITYDNSDIPFIRSYFAGGSNDIRAWQTYELGPGRRNTGLEYNTGSFKFLTSAEYRFDVFSMLKGAFFIDAGNIWDISKSSFVDDDSKFKNLSSLKNIAIGSGFGARLDFNFLIFRFDIGFKTYEPYLNDSKWFSNFNFANAVYNIGINYPF
jgi:outer membrane translocation and assembly module TamA